VACSAVQQPKLAAFPFRHVGFYTDEGGLDDVANLFHDGLSVSA